MTEVYPRLSTENDERSITLERYYSLHSRQQQARRRLSTSSTSSNFSLISPTSPTSTFTTLSQTTRESSPTASILTPLTSTLPSTNPSPSRSPTRLRSHNHSRITRTSPPPFLTMTSTDSAIDDTDSFTPCFSRSSSIGCSGTPESDLLELNNDIKATLTTLLNLPSVRREEGGEMRSWCQERLMDAEMEMRRLRRGICRGCAGVVVQ